MSDLRPYRTGVGIVLLNPDRRIFAGRRIDTPEAWQMPQGGVDPGEAPDRAALRELAEEVGTDAARIIGETAGWIDYDLPPELSLRLSGGRFRGQRQKWFAMEFLGTDADIDLATAHPEFDAWVWMSADDLLDSIVPFKRALYRSVLGEFAPLLVPPGASGR